MGGVAGVDRLGDDHGRLRGDESLSGPEQEQSHEKPVVDAFDVDADPQANASSGLGIDIRTLEFTIYECLIDGVPPRQAIHPCEVENLFVLPSHIDLVGAEIEMLSNDERERVMKKLLVQLKDDYDYILIDCSPSLGLITVNALTASDSVIIPVQCEYFALEGISKLLNTIKIIKSKYN